METEGRINIEELSPHPQNPFFFDDIEGDNWNSLLQSIRTSNVTNAITITQNKVIISGHQRIRACKLLGIKEVSYKMIEYPSEKEEIKDLIESNLRQRVLNNTNPLKLGRCFEFLNEYYGLSHGGNHGNQYTVASRNNFHLANQDSDAPQTQKALAESYDITQRTMNNYMRLTNMIPELVDLVDTGIVTSTTARAIMRELSEDEQRELISSLPEVSKITKKQIEQHIAELKSQNEQLKKELATASTPQKVVEVREIDKTDYTKVAELEEKLENTQKECSSIYESFHKKSKEAQELQEKVSELEAEKAEHKQEKYIQDSCFIFNARIRKFLEDVGGYVWLSSEINNMPKVEQEGYLLSIQLLEDWVSAMKFNIEKEKGDKLV